MARLLIPVVFLSFFSLTGCDQQEPVADEEPPRQEQPEPSPAGDTEPESQPQPGEQAAGQTAPEPEPETEPQSREVGMADPALTETTIPDVPTVEDTRMEISEPNRPDGGRIDGEVYRNDFFGFSIALPDQWYPAAPREFKQITNRGTDLIAGENDEDTRTELEEAGADPENFQLLIVSKQPFDSTDVANPSIMIIAEKVEADADGEQYLRDLHDMLDNSLLSYTRQGAIGQEQRSGVTWHLADYRIETPDATLLQSYIVTIRRGYALSFIITDTDRASLSALREFALNADFEPAA